MKKNNNLINKSLSPPILDKQQVIYREVWASPSKLPKFIALLEASPSFTRIEYQPITETSTVERFIYEYIKDENKTRAIIAFDTKSHKLSFNSKAKIVKILQDMFGSFKSNGTQLQISEPPIIAPIQPIELILKVEQVAKEQKIQPVSKLENIKPNNNTKFQNRFSSSVPSDKGKYDSSFQVENTRKLKISDKVKDKFEFVSLKSIRKDFSKETKQQFISNKPTGANQTRPVLPKQQTQTQIFLGATISGQNFNGKKQDNATKITIGTTSSHKNHNKQSTLNTTPIGVDIGYPQNNNKNIVENSIVEASTNRLNIKKNEIQEAKTLILSNPKAQTKTTPPTLPKTQSTTPSSSPLTHKTPQRPKFQLVALNKLKKLIPNAFDYLSEQTKTDLANSLTDIYNNRLRLTDYSVLLVPSYRALERLIFDLQSSKGISTKMIGQAYEKNEKGEYRLKSGYIKKINSIVYNEVMSALYTEYFIQRHAVTHSDNLDQTSGRVVRNITDAQKTFTNLLDIINYNCKKLQEIGFSVL
ncbi:MAG: hypothetical protein FWE13_02130 [Firmicutes bacterium]|nr:hypothetical protein [Bacillota bacterium]